jgi:hypothetical protein
MRTLSKRIVTFLIEYLGEFEFIFKTILDYDSGDQMCSSHAKKNRRRKSYAWAHLNSGCGKQINQCCSFQNRKMSSCSYGYDLKPS